MYSTDLEETQWQVIKKILNPQERKRKYDLREIWNAIFYIIKTGCQWRMLPGDFAPWKTVYYYYRKWSSLGEIDLLLNDLSGKVRLRMGQKREAGLGIMDSRSVRWGDNRSPNGFDGNKKVKGIKRHLAVDKNGFPLAVMVTDAGVHDGTASLTLTRILKDSLSPVKVILADAGYQGKFAERIRRDTGYKVEIVVSGDKKKGFKPLKKRWVVERTFAWFDNYRRLCRNYERAIETAEIVVKISAIRLLLNKI